MQAVYSFATKVGSRVIQKSACFSKQFERQNKITIVNVCVITMYISCGKIEEVKSRCKRREN